MGDILRKTMFGCSHKFHFKISRNFRKYHADSNCNCYSSSRWALYIFLHQRCSQRAKNRFLILCVATRPTRSSANRCGAQRAMAQQSGQLKEIPTHTHWSLEVNPLYSQPISEQSKKARFFLTVCTSASTENFKIENIQCNGWKSRNRALLKNKEKRHMFLFWYRKKWKHFNYTKFQWSSVQGNFKTIGAHLGLE